MKVCIDVQAAVSQRAGVGRYVRELVDHLPEWAGADGVELFYFDFRGRAQPFRAAGAKARVIRWCPGRWVQGVWKTIGWPPYEWLAGKADVYHFPNFILPPLGHGHAVVTIHDVSFMRFPEMAETRNLKHLLDGIGRTVRRADAILADSRVIADEIVQVLGAAPSKVHTVYPGISTGFQPSDEKTVAAMRQRLNIDRPYLLAVGTIEPRKNLPFLFEVFEHMREFDGLLILVGSMGWKYEAILTRLRASPRAGAIRHLQGVAESDLRALYSGAELLLFPSFYEGFGFPPLEALACGTPVVSSAGGSLREVLGSAATIVDSFDVEAWSAAALRQMGDRSRAKQGRAHAAQYSWSATARAAWEVYRGLAAC